MQKLNNMVLMTEEEYSKLNSPDTRYTIMTKTSAELGVKNMLKYFKFKCWHDPTSDYDFDDGVCSICPVMTVLGDDAGVRLCTRQKCWSK